MPRVKELTGMRFGKLVALYRDGINNQNRAMWMCQCDCGNRKRISSHDLQHNTVSCGCHLQKVRLKNLEKGWSLNKKKEKKIKHKKQTLAPKGESRTRLYRIWDGMKRRCYNPKHIHYKSYGGRGIKIRDEWLNDFLKFKEWSLRNGYSDKLCIDRTDNNGNYEPNNCRWVTYKENCNNTRTNRLITINGQPKR